MTHRMLLFCILLIGTMVVDCRKSEPPVTGKTIGVSLSARDGEFRKQLEEGIVTRANQHRYELLLTTANGDINKQRSDMEDFIRRRVDAILVEPVHPDSLARIHLLARAEGIPLFTIYGRAGDTTVVSDVRSDEENAATEAAVFFNDRLGKGRHIIIIGDTLDPSFRERIPGFRSALGPAVALDYIVPWGNDEAVIRTLSAVMGEWSDTGGIYALDEHGTRLSASAVMRTGRRMAVVLGWDDSKWAVDAILREDGLTAVVNRFPGKIGGEAVEVMRAHFAQQPVQPRILVSAGIIDRPSLMKRAIR